VKGTRLGDALSLSSLGHASDLVGLKDVRQAADRLRGVTLKTPLLPAPLLEDELGVEVRLKCENLQRTGSFKARGAYHYITRLSERELQNGVITYSSGNHAQAVALAARLRHVKAMVVMPTTAPEVKRAGAAQLGAEIVLEGTTSLERMVRAEAIAAERGFAIIPPFDHPWIIAGQGTVGLEVADEWPEVDTVLLPVGGGGLVSGSAAALRRLLPGVRIVGVEPEGSASMKAALDEGRPVRLDRIDTIADGLAPVQAGELTFRHVKELVDEVVTVSDEAIREATVMLIKQIKLMVEYSGAATVAALRSGAVSPGRRTVAVLSGGNMDPSILRTLL
jgi:threonine dehydratase